MSTDALQLQTFYASPLGRVCHRLIGQHLRRLWPNPDGQVVAGLGYATPYLSLFQNRAERTLALMPAIQGAVPWPEEGLTRVTLCEDDNLPLPDMSVDCVLLVHSLEYTENPSAVLEETWRILNGNGRLLIVVPNRRGIWARLDTTPFGHGTPYSLSQIRHILKKAQFIPEASRSVLFFPPFPSAMFLKTAGIWERLGHLLFGFLNGVYVIEARKQMYAAAPRPVVRLRQRVLFPLPTPANRTLSSRARR